MTFYGILWHKKHFMMTLSLEHQEKCVLVPFQHYLARAAGFEQVLPNRMVKNAIFTAFYGILQHKMSFTDDSIT